MYCPHCAKKIDEKKIEQISSFKDVEEINSDTTISYVCPRCGHLITSNLSEAEVKSLIQAAHAQVQRGNNSFASGMGLIIISIISLIISFLFFLLAKKPSNGYQLSTSCTEFYVCLSLLIFGIILLSIGGVLFIKGLKCKHDYLNLLKDLNNKTFVQ